jgi:tetratricopeptide (TPR) repeat protein
MRPYYLGLGLLIAGFAYGASADFDAAMALVKERKYPEARAALQKIATAEPRNAAACYQLGMVIKMKGDTPALEEATQWLAKAVELEPNNALYLADFGGTSMQLAGRTRSVSAATKGREAMEKSLVINPDNLNAREGLFQFYTQAPWPIGSSSKAAAQLEEIRKRDPDRATVLSVLGKTTAKEWAAAFKLCDEVLAKKPDNYTALYQYGRTAALSGQNLERGLANLKKCLALPPPTPASPTHSNAWQRIGNIEEQLKHPSEARAAYETALKLDPANRQAADALAKMK